MPDESKSLTAGGGGASVAIRGADDVRAIDQRRLREELRRDADAGGRLVSGANGPVFFDAAAIEWQAHPRFPQIDVKHLQPGAAHPAGAFSLMRVKVAAGGRIDPHTHPVETETACVLRGSARLLCGDAVTELRAGGGVSIPPGLEHSLEADSEVELLAIHAPPLR